MDRTVFAVCAGLLSLAIFAGCDAPPAPPEPDHAPLVLAELKAASPGPWRRSSPDAIAPMSLERLPDASAREPMSLSLPAETSLPATVPSSGPPASSEAAPAAEAAAPQPTDTSLRMLDAAGAGLAAGASGRTPGARGNRPLEPAPIAPSAAAPLPLETAAAPLVPTRTVERLPAPPAPPSREMLAALRQADAHVQAGIKFSERGALFLARAEYLAALQLVAQAHDIATRSQAYSDALAAGMLALEESHDFVRPRRAGKKIDMRLATDGHKTPVLKGEAVEALAPVVAAERYHAYAQDQLAVAAARQPAASRALYGLGKLAVAVGQDDHAPEMHTASQAAALYQAALLADASNGRAANELGVILARQGELARARDLLAHSVRVTPHPATHRNLAQVAARLGDARLAEAADRHAVAMEQAGHSRSGPAVEWLDPATFAATAPAGDAPLPATQAPPAAPPAGAPAATTARKPASDWLPWSTRR